MKLLIFTDIPPTHALTAGLVLDRLVRFLPTNSVVCFAALNPAVDAPRPVDLGWLPVYYTSKPSEQGSERFAKWPWLRDLWGAGVELYRRQVLGARLLKKAVWFGRQHNVDAVLAVLQGQTMINLAQPVAKALNAPLYTLVWDPFSWWVRGHRVDPITDKLTHRNLDQAIRSSQACAVASWAMAEAYEKKYAVRSIPVIASHDAKLAHTPAPRLHHDDRVVIGMAGQFYASQEWNQLVLSLRCAGWQIDGKPVYIRTMGGAPPPSDIPKARLEHLGWKSQPDMVKALSECDLLYCPYPFADAMIEVSKLSFPSKLVAYFAAGRPAVFHGPLDSSPARYLAARDAGVCVGAPHASSIYNAMRRLVAQPEYFRRIAENGQRAFREDFTLERMRENFFAFLGKPDNGARPDTAAAEFVEPMDDRNHPLVKVRSRRVRPTPRHWLAAVAQKAPPIARMHKRIAVLEARVSEMESWQTVNEAELSALYMYAAGLAKEKQAAERSLEASHAGKDDHAAECRNLIDKAAM